jgi:hypothetical protein
MPYAEVAAFIFSHEKPTATVDHRKFGGKHGVGAFCQREVSGNFTLN